MLSKEVPFGSPAEFASNMSRHHYSELLGREVSAEEEQKIIGLLIMPGGVNPSIYHGYFTQVVLRIEDGDGLDSVSVVVVPAIVRIPSAIVVVHAPVPVNIIVCRIVEHVIVV